MVTLNLQNMFHPLEANAYSAEKNSRFYDFEVRGTPKKIENFLRGSVQNFEKSWGFVCRREAEKYKLPPVKTRKSSVLWVICGTTWGGYSTNNYSTVQNKGGPAFKVHQKRISMKRNNFSCCAYTRYASNVSVE